MTDRDSLIAAAGGPRPADDLVERLRDRNKRGWDDHDKAAAEIERLRAENARLRSEAEYWRITAAHRGQQIPNTSPVAWMRADGSEGSVTTMTVCISDKVRELWLKANPKQVERYTIPLYTMKASP